MDEPLSNLDAKLRAQTRVELIRLHRRIGRTVLYVTHDQVEAMTMGERIAVMDRGRLQQVGSPNEVYSRPSNLFVAQFIGTPAMTIFEGRVIEREGVTTVDTGDFAMRLTDDQTSTVRTARAETIAVGVRPEHIALAAQFGERPVAASFTARVDVIEALGNEIHATLLLNGRALVVRLAPDASITVGADERFAIAPECLLLFDPRDGRLIT
jgi:multiple sugar transport system ATP-binding protein